MIDLLESPGCRITMHKGKWNEVLNHSCNIFKKQDNALIPFFILRANGISRLKMEIQLSHDKC